MSFFFFEMLLKKVKCFQFSDRKSYFFFSNQEKCLSVFHWSCFLSTQPFTVHYTKMNGVIIKYFQSQVL